MALSEANLSGHELLSAVTSWVSDLHLDEQRRFLAQLISSMPPLLLGEPPSAVPSDSVAPSIKKKLLAPFTRKNRAIAALRPSMTFTRRTQARVCKALGLIASEDQFSEQTLQDYLAFFKDPMTSAQAERLGVLAGLATPAAIHLPDSDLQAILDEVLTRAA